MTYFIKKIAQITIFLICLLTLVFAQDIQWYDAIEFPIEGQGWQTTAHPYDRLPASAESLVRPKVWELAQNSAGLSISFTTNSPEIQLRWTTRFNNSMPHMTDIGIKGFDLYCWSENDNNWKWAGSAKGWNAGPRFQAKVVEKMDRTAKRFKLYFPLYDAPDSLEIGIDSRATIQPYSQHYVLNKPVVFYGTSITQGGCASRPGLAYPAIIGRELNIPTINLGFSGNGNMEIALAHLLADIDAACYVLDNLPNMTPEMVAERAIPFVNYLRAKHPTTPVILVATALTANAWLTDSTRIILEQKNTNLAKAYETLRQSQKSPIYLLRPEDLKSSNNEGTVDGTHLNDLGFVRFAERLLPTIRKALNNH